MSRDFSPPPLYMNYISGTYRVLSRSYIKRMLKETLLSVNKFNVADSWTQVELSGTNRAFSKFPVTARIEPPARHSRLHFYLKCRTIKAACTTARVLPVLVLAPNWPERVATGNEGAASLSSDLHSKRARCVSRSLLLLHGALLVAATACCALHPTVSSRRRRTYPNIITRHEASLGNRRPLYGCTPRARSPKSPIP